MISYSKQDIDIMAKTIFGEARGEYSSQHSGISGLIAVANVIMNRLNAGGFGESIAGVCQKPFQFSCWNRTDPNLAKLRSDEIYKDPKFAICMEIATNVAAGNWPDLTHGADHYHAYCCSPSWAKKSALKVKIGRHLFYKLK